MRIGFDIGGTKIAGLAINEYGAAIAQTRVLLPKSYDEVPAICAQIVRDFEDQTDQLAASVGLSVAGPVNPDGVSVFAPHIPSLHNQPLARDLARLTQKPVALANDANCFALSEAIDGAGEGARVVFGVILGTGVGGGLVIDGRIFNGRQSLAGEWGHASMPWRQPEDGAPLQCSWGHSGCIETVLSGAALQRLFLEKTRREADGAEIGRLATKRDPQALEVVGIYAERLARALTTLTVVIDPDIIVLGGSVSLLPGLIEKVTAIWDSGHHYLRPEPTTTIRMALAKHGPDSGVRGAAWLAATALEEDEKATRRSRKKFG